MHRSHYSPDATFIAPRLVDKQFHANLGVIVFNIGRDTFYASIDEARAMSAGLQQVIDDYYDTVFPIISKEAP